MPQMLVDKKADLVTAVMPFALSPALNQIGSPLYDLTEGLGTSQFLMFAARKAYIDKHRAVMVDVMEDLLRIERWYLTPRTTRMSGRSLPIWSSCRPNASSGCSPGRTTIAIPI